jgi:hypothetical protein
MLPNEKFALECRDRYAEDGLVVDESNGEFAHCPLPKSMGDSGYYLLHDDHQWQGLLQSRDVGKKCYWTGDVKRWLLSTHFVEGYFELWDIYDEYNRGEHSCLGVTRSEETRRKISESLKGRKGPTRSEEFKRRISESRRGKRHSEETIRNMTGRRHTEERKRKISEAKKGRQNGRLGYTHTEETKRKMSESAKNRRKNQPENHEEND